MARILTGVEGLDEIMRGGFVEGDSVLVAGSPGTGKTSLGMQFAYNGITKYDEPGFLITFEEFPQQIYRDALSFGWDFRRLEEEGKLRVLFTSPELMQQDIQRQEGLLKQMIREINARRVVVDSITHLRRLTDDPGEFREMIYGVINALKHEGLTSMLIRELVESEVPGAGSEEYIADSVIYLTRENVNGQRMRFLEVIKSRGTHHLPGRSLFFIHDEGVRVVPPYRSPFYRFDQAASTGHSGLDDPLGGGIPDGAFYLIEVSSDIHQRLFEVNFLREALTAGDAIVVIDRAASLPATLVDAAARFGMADALDAAYQSEQVVVVAPEADVPAALKSIRERVQKGTKIRVFLNVTRAATGMNHDDFLRDLQIFADALRESGAIAMATLDRDVFNLQAVERIRSVADGIISVWREGSYNYLQVLKTVNSARTPVSAFLEVAEPPFIELLQY
jgi:KaiC/GvpD/RAD55 family RecA-like ATPase